MKSNFCTTDTEKSHQLKKYKPPVLIVLVASILIFSMLSTSVFASSIINLDFNTYKYLMSMDNVNYVLTFNGSSNDIIPSFNATTSTISDSQIIAGESDIDNPLTFNVNGRYVPGFTFKYGTYLYIPLMLSNVNSFDFNFYIGYSEPSFRNISISSVDVLSVYGGEIGYSYGSISQLRDPSFVDGYNTIYFPDSTVQTTTSLYCEPYYISVDFGENSYDVGFLRIVITNSYGSTGDLFYGADNFNIILPDRQMTSLSTIIQGNFSSFITYLSQINGNMNLNHAQTVSLLNQIINIEYQDQEQVSEIQQAMEELQNSLDQIGEDLNSIARPPADDFDFDMDTVTDGKADFSSFQGSESPIGVLFENDTISTMLKTVLSICSIGFICFGKR